MAGRLKPSGGAGRSEDVARRATMLGSLIGFEARTIKRGVSKRGQEVRKNCVGGADRKQRLWRAHWRGGESRQMVSLLVQFSFGICGALFGAFTLGPEEGRVCVE